MTRGAPRALAALLAASALTMSACSLLPGASPAEGPSASSPTIEPATPGATATSPGADPGVSGVAASGVPGQWGEALALIDAARSGAAARALQVDERLSALAEHQAVHYASGAEDWDGDFGADLAAAGFAQGSARVGSGGSAGEAAEAWLASPEQAAALLDPQLGFVGVASAPWQGEQSVYVVVLGYRADDGSIPAGSGGAAEVLDRTNAERALGGLGPLTSNEQLDVAAQSQADHQAAILEMTHEGNGGLGERVRTAGYTPRVAAENVAVGYPSVAEVIQGWVDSPGHYENIMNPDVTEMGFAVAFGSDGRAYYAQVFGAPL